MMLSAISSARFLAGCLWLAAGFTSAAIAGNSPLIFSHATIVIERHSQPTVSETPNDASVAATPLTTVFAPLTIDVTIRDAASFYNQEGWFNLDGLKEGRGILLVFDDPVSAPIVSVNQYAPLDILMVDSQGSISEIAPSLVLANLEDHIYPKTPIKAFLLMAGGSHERHGIHPGDEIRYSIFKKPPPVLDANSPAASPLSVTPPQAETVITPAASTANPDLSVKRQPIAQPQAPAERTAKLP